MLARSRLVALRASAGLALTAVVTGAAPPAHVHAFTSRTAVPDLSAPPGEFGVTSRSYRDLTPDGTGARFLHSMLRVQDLEATLAFFQVAFESLPLGSSFLLSCAPTVARHTLFAMRATATRHSGVIRRACCRCLASLRRGAPRSRRPSSRLFSSRPRRASPRSELRACGTSALGTTVLGQRAIIRTLSRENTAP